MHALFSLIEALTTIQPGTAQQLEEALQAQIVLKKENDYYRFWGINDPLELGNGVRINRVNYATPKKDPKPPSITLDDISGTCISREALREKFGHLGFPYPPNNPAPRARTTWRIEINGIEVGFGFRNDNPDCLSSIGMRFSRM